MCNKNCVLVYKHYYFHFAYSIDSYLLRNVQSASVLPEREKGNARALWAPCWSQQAEGRPVVGKEGTEEGLLSDIREVQCLICSLLHQMFIADPNIAKLVHFQVMTSVITDYNRGGKPLLVFTHLKFFVMLMLNMYFVDFWVKVVPNIKH